MIKFYCEEEYLKPYKKHVGDAGYDLKAKETIILKPNETKIISTGVRTVMPVGIFAITAGRSSMNAKGIVVNQGIIDNGYIGEIKVVMHNTTKESFTIHKGERFAQLVFLPLLNSDYKTYIGTPGIETDRGSKGFGSTGGR